MNDEFIYLDNAATTWPKPEPVYRAVEQAMRVRGANPGRSSHRMSMQAERIIEEARLAAAQFFNAPSAQHVVFTLNCTDSLNIVLKGLLKPGDRVVTGPYEHNSVMRPLRGLQGAGVAVAVVRGTADFRIDLDHLRSLCKDGIDYAVLSHVSNVTGCVLPIREIAEIVREGGGVLILDASQSAGVIDIDMRELGVDILAAPGHKSLLGPMGVGLLALGRDIPIKPLREGGTGIKSEGDYHPQDLPWRLEAGTANLPGIAGLLAGIEFIRSEGIGAIARHEAELAGALAAGLRAIDGARLFCDPGEPQTGVVSFVLDAVDVSLAGTILDQAFHIGVRAGLHCAPAAHQALGTFPAGTLRAGFGYFNNDQHVERLLSAVREILSDKT